MCWFLVLSHRLHWLQVNMVKGVGPVFPHPLQDPTHLSRLIPAAKLNVKQSLGAYLARVVYYASFILINCVSR